MPSKMRKNALSNCHNCHAWGIRVVECPFAETKRAVAEGGWNIAKAVWTFAKRCVDFREESVDF